MLWLALALFVAVDTIVVAIVLRRALRRRDAAGGPDLGSLARFARDAGEEAGAYLKANYGGEPDALPRVLQGLAELLGQRARGEGLSLDRATLRRLAGRVALAQRVARPRDIEAALATLP